MQDFFKMCCFEENWLYCLSLYGIDFSVYNKVYFKYCDRFIYLVFMQV